MWDLFAYKQIKLFMVNLIERDLIEYRLSTLWIEKLCWYTCYAFCLNVPLALLPVFLQRNSKLMIPQIQ